MTAIRVLVVDDESAMVQLIQGYLTAEGMDVLVARDGLSAVSSVERYQPDVVVLDLMLPGVDGFEVIRRIRTMSDAYVLMVTARGEEIDRLTGLAIGADDYLTKPFSPRELVARVKVLLRRPRGRGAGEEERFEASGLVIDRARHSVTVDGSDVDLTALEFELLGTLASEPGLVFSRQRLLDRVWGPDHVGDEHLVDVHIGNLRRKLGDPPQQPRFIETVRSVGFRFRSAGASR